MVHVQVAVRLEPVLVGFDTERTGQPQAALRIREDSHDMGAALDLLVQPLQHVGAFQILVVLARQPKRYGYRGSVKVAVVSRRFRKGVIG
jgi:hypothetical protein